MFLAVSSLFLVPVLASGGGTTPDGCGGSCADCHSLTDSEALGMLKASAMVPADARVKKVEMVQSAGLWRVTLDVKGEKPLYIDFGKRNVVVGEMFPIKQSFFAPVQEDLLK
ncbi:MAG: hypothetical protein P8Y77_03630 [Nitrospirota bacterium]